MEPSGYEARLAEQHERREHSLRERNEEFRRDLAVRMERIHAAFDRLDALNREMREILARIEAGMEAAAARKPLWPPT